MNECTMCTGSTNKVCPTAIGGSVGTCAGGCPSCIYSDGPRNSYLLGDLCRGIYIYIYIFCIECDLTCLTCNGTTFSDCFTCKSQYEFCEIDHTLHTGKCISSCSSDCQINSHSSYLNTLDDTCYGIYKLIYI